MRLEAITPPTTLHTPTQTIEKRTTALKTPKDLIFDALSRGYVSNKEIAFYISTISQEKFSVKYELEKITLNP